MDFSAKNILTSLTIFMAIPNSVRMLYNNISLLTEPQTFLKQNKFLPVHRYFLITV